MSPPKPATAPGPDAGPTMSPQARADTEAQAERALRRGELAEAVGLLEAVATAFPDDARAQARLAQVRESLQPEELHRARSRPALTPAEPLAAVSPRSPVEEAERLFSHGDYVGAAAAYRRALQERPDSELLRERLEEVFRLAQASRPGPPSAPAPRAALPADPAARLQALLDRLASRRRPRHD